MKPENEAKEKLFSYGTLQYEAVQLSTFGRKLTGNADALMGFRLSLLKISDPQVIATSGAAEHPVLKATGNHADEIPGMVFDLTPSELEQADKYEAADYKRIQVNLRSGCPAWVYVGIKD